MTAQGQIYIIKLREFVNSGEDVYKFGITEGPVLTRMNGYPKGSHLLYTDKCTNPRAVENRVIAIVSNSSKFTHRTDIGREYVEGDFDEIKKTIINTVKFYGHELVGRKINKYFEEANQSFNGIITSYTSPYYHIMYSDGDNEEMTVDEVGRYLLEDKKRKKKQGERRS